MPANDRDLEKETQEIGQLTATDNDQQRARNVVSLDSLTERLLEGSRLVAREDSDELRHRHEMEKLAELRKRDWDRFVMVLVVATFIVACAIAGWNKDATLRPAAMSLFPLLVSSAFALLAGRGLK